MKHEFTDIIMGIIEEKHPGDSQAIYNNSELIRYINYKTKSASSGSKSRGSFGNLYAIYVLVEEYLKIQPKSPQEYINSEGAAFSSLLERTRQLPFGKKIQNHSLNSRMNEEFKKYFPESGIVPIIRSTSTQRYWINPDAIIINIGREINISELIISIIDRYIDTKKSSLSKFLSQCENLLTIDSEAHGVADFIKSLLEPNVDARIFEIVAFAILKEKYADEQVYFGHSLESIKRYNLQLYKTGRTNANDGGIDYVMKPLGRFFQVTETLDVKKYFLDIDKVERFPISFVIKTDIEIERIINTFRADAKKIYKIDKVVDEYMNAVEEIINIPCLLKEMDNIIQINRTEPVLKEIIKQSRLEFHYDDSEETEA